MDLFSRRLAAAALIDGQHFTFPGYGTVEGVYVSARIDHARKVVEPPQLEVRWNVVADPSAQTFAELLIGTGATRVEASATEQAWLGALAAGTPIAVGDLGTLRLDGETDLITFDPDAAGLARAYWRAEPLTLAPLPRKTAGSAPEAVGSDAAVADAAASADAVSEPATRETPSPAPPPRTRRRWMLYALAAACALLAVVAWQLLAPGVGWTAAGRDGQALQISQDRLNRSPWEQLDAPVAPPQRDELEYAITDPEGEVGTDAQLNDVPLEDAPLDDAPGGFAPDELPGGDVPPTGFDPAALAGEGGIGSAAPAGIDAVVIIGTFGDPANVDALSARLTRAGLVPYTDEWGRMTRVGVAFMASSPAEVDAVLERLRNEYNRGAFVLE